MAKTEEMKIPELKREYKSLYDMIFNVDCFGVSDLYRLEQVEMELLKRGYTVSEFAKVKIVKGGN